MEKKLKRVVSWVLAVAMVMTSLVVPQTKASAAYDASSGLTVHFKYTGNDDTKWDIAAINTWSGTSTDKTTVTKLDGSELEELEIPSWKSEDSEVIPTRPKMDKDGEWFTVKVTGSVLGGIQFIYPYVDGTTDKTIEAVDAKNFEMLPSGSTNIYYVYDGVSLKAYSDAECTNQLDASINVHFVNNRNWDNVYFYYWNNVTSTTPDSSEVNPDENGWYSVNIVPNDGMGFAFYKDSSWSDKCQVNGGFSDKSKDYWIVAGENSEQYTVQIPPTSLILPTSVILGPDKDTDLSIKATPDNGYMGVVWTSADDTIATVNEIGKVTAKNLGETTITATSLADSSVKATVTVKVQDIKVSNIELSATTLELKKNQKTTLKAVVTPDNANDTSVTWASDNSCVTVDEDGNITAVSEGTANVSATSNDGTNVSASCTVKVSAEETKQVNSVTVSDINHKLIVGETVKLESTVSPSDANYINTTYASSDNKIASVSEDGTVTATGVGTATITVSTDNQATDFAAGTCTITVGDTYMLRGDAIGWNPNLKYAFKYVDDNTMEMVNKLSLEKGYYSFKCATDGDYGWGKRVGNDKEYVTVQNPSGFM